jgi:SdrD B-like domain
MPSSHQQLIEGIIFVDANVNGEFDPGEAGLSGLTVQLDNGHHAVTGPDGRYRFVRLDAGLYRVSISLGQFGEAVRMTTSVDVPVILPADDRVNFGIVNFSRLLGNVFNDYAQNGMRQADAPGLQAVTLLVSGAGGERKVTTDSTGDYEIDDLLPGEYELSLDTATLPPNYVVVAGPMKFQVKPTASVIKDIPVRALRSIAGHVYLRVNAAEGSAEPALSPLAGIQITADHAVVTTDADGRFVLRDLPAGDFRVTLVPVRPVPEGLQVPAGMVRLPKSPTQVDNAVIVLSNPALLDYLRKN